MQRSALSLLQSHRILNLSEGRFMSALAKRVSSAKDKRIMVIFQEEIALLQTQADNIGISLKSFYEAAL